jgi:glutamyl-tRNA reductase
MPDLEHAIYQTGVHFFNFIKDARILVIGASEVNEKTVALLQMKGLYNITVCNRSSMHAREFSNKFKIASMDWKFLKNWHQFDWIILGTKASRYLIGQKDLPNERMGIKLVMDLSVPRNVDPSLGRHSEITLLNIDQINRMLRVRKQRMSHLLAEAEQLVAFATERHFESFQQRSSKLTLIQSA